METTRQGQSDQVRDTRDNCDGGGTSWGCRPATMTSQASATRRRRPRSPRRCTSTDPNSSRDGRRRPNRAQRRPTRDLGPTARETPPGACLADLRNTRTHELGQPHGLRAQPKPKVTDRSGSTTRASGAEVLGRCSPAPNAARKTRDHGRHDVPEAGVRRDQEVALSTDEIQASARSTRPPRNRSCSRSEEGPPAAMLQRARGRGHARTARCCAGVVALWYAAAGECAGA